MVDKQTIGISSLITLSIVLASMIGPSYFDTTNFYCEAESSILKCPGGLSGGSATRCYLNEEKSSWDYCKGGWIQVTDDRPIQEEPEEKEPEEESREPSTGVWGKQWLCSTDGCVALT